MYEKHFSVLSRLLAGFSFSWWSHTLHHKVAGKSQRRTLGLIYRIPFFGFEMEAYTQWVLLTLIADDKFHLVGGKNTFVVLSEIIFHNFDTKIYCRFPRNPFTIDKVDQWPDHLWQPWKDSPHRAPGTNLQKRQITKPSTSDQYYGGVGMLISAALYVIVY